MRTISFRGLARPVGGGSEYEQGEPAPKHAATRCRRGVPGSVALLVVSVMALAGAGCELPTGLPGFESTFVIPAEDVSLAVIGAPTTAWVTDDLAGVDASIIERVAGGALIVHVSNAVGATGTVMVTISNGSVSAIGTVDVSGPAGQRIELTGDQVRSFVGGEITLRGSGTLCASAGCGSLVLPPPMIHLDNRIELRLRIGAEAGR
jgi:hypothetical protein